ncbi:MAG: 50S ribosomal protein L11 methyltransferase, partial [Chitinophagaceae bacterium]
DEWSINNANENFVTNNCSDIVLLQKDNPNDLEIFDIILANINLNVVTNSIEGFSVASHQSSHFLLSGFLSSDEPVLIDAFSQQNFKNILTSNNREWISMLLTKA